MSDRLSTGGGWAGKINTLVHCSIIQMFWFTDVISGEVNRTMLVRVTSDKNCRRVSACPLFTKGLENIFFAFFKYKIYSGVFDLSITLSFALRTAYMFTYRVGNERAQNCFGNRL
jgi:hypothetical protein